MKKDWLKFIGEHHLQNWNNVYQTKAMEAEGIAAQKPGYRQLYDVTLIPTLYLLDKEKHIVAKKLTWQQIDDFLKVKWALKTN